MYTLSHSTNEHIDLSKPTTSSIYKTHPEGNNANTSDLEQVGAWCAEISDNLDPEINMTHPETFLTLLDSPSFTDCVPVIFDTGASLAITSHLSDFVGPVTAYELKLGGMAKDKKITGRGLVIWNFKSTTGTIVPVKTMAYYVPEADTRLLSPQKVKGGSYHGDDSGFTFKIEGHTIYLPYHTNNSLPIGYALIERANPQANLVLTNDDNQNLTLGQKLLLHWHHRFGHLNFLAVQRILQRAPFLSAKYAAGYKCNLYSLKCAICEYAKGHRRSVHPRQHQPTKRLSQPVELDTTVGALKIGHLKPGAEVSVDHFESRILGRTFDSYGKVTSETYKGGCIFADHGSGFIHVEMQLGFSGVETIRAKQEFERMAILAGVHIESYLTDSGAFKAHAFVRHIQNHNQQIHYCGANAHHKNGVAERAVKSISNMARAMLLHASSHWKDNVDASLWPMAVKYAVHLFNNLPNEQNLCPADIFMGVTIPRHRLASLHVWGCPVYILDARLQAGQKIPRWQPRSRQGMFVGISSLHSSDVPLILNMQTGSITPQFHVVFDDYFSTVTSISDNENPPGSWEDLCLENSVHIIDEDTNQENCIDSFTYLNDEWLTKEELLAKQRSSVRSSFITQTYKDMALPTVPSPLLPLLPETTIPSSQDTKDTPTDTTLDLPPGELPTEPITLESSSRDVVITNNPSVDNTPKPTLLRRSTRTTKGQLTSKRYEDEFHFASISNEINSLSQQEQLHNAAQLLFCPTTGYLDTSDPSIFLAFHSTDKGHDSDSPSFYEAIHGPYSTEYREAMRTEIEALEKQNTWDSILRPPNQRVLKSTWVFKLKRLPDGTPQRHKARFCVRGDLQIEGIDFFETYAPVVQWSTIRLLLGIVLTEGWSTQQVDYTNAFAQAEIHEEIYVEYPKLFKSVSGEDRVLKLKKSLYGLRQAPKTFYDKLRLGLLERGWQQSKIDPCLFMKPGMICVVYVDDTIIGALDITDINREILSLGILDKTKKHVFTLRNEGAVSDFLGIRIQQIDKLKFKLTQLGLIEKILTTMNLEECNGCQTPATSEPLHADTDGPTFKESWKYDSVIGMMMYLANNTRPEIAYAVHQAARFTHQPRHSHAIGVKRIARYLKQTKNEGMLFCPQTPLQIDCYVDADFAGTFSVADKQDPVSVKSRTGYVIMYRGAPLLWVSKMQTQIALSTMEAEYIALSQAMRDLIPIREVLKEIMTTVFNVAKNISYVTHTKSAHTENITHEKYNIPSSTVFEDNNACLKFAQMPRLTPRTKHIGVPYHWF
jgi:Reverse transcriptase (RNA-dependent DNA polymerase)